MKLAATLFVLSVLGLLIELVRERLRHPPTNGAGREIEEVFRGR